MKPMNTLLFFLPSLVSVFILGSCAEDTSITYHSFFSFVDNTRFEAKENFSQTLDGSGITKLDLEGTNGEIIVAGDPGTDVVMISAMRRVRSESVEDADYHLKDLKVDVHVLGNRILVSTAQPQFSGGRQYIVDYTITVPRDLDVDVSSVNGRVEATGLLSSTHVDLVNGKIAGNVSLPTGGTIDMNVINGGLELEIPASTSARLSATAAVTGEVSVSGIDIRITAQSPRSLRGECGDGSGTISLNTTNGNIRVTGY